MEYLRRACREYGLELIAPYEIKLPSGLTLVAGACLPQLGGEGGMLIFERYPNEMQSMTEHDNNWLFGRYGCTSFDLKGNGSEYNPDSWKETFRDWGWSDTSGDPPDWMKD